MDTNNSQSRRINILKIVLSIAMLLLNAGVVIFLFGLINDRISEIVRLL